MGEIAVEREEAGTRVAYVEAGKHISDLVIYDRWMWLGRARLHVGGVGNVGTHERSRHRGLARQILSAAVEWMEPRFDLSMLFGIPDFYGKFGYASCIPEYRGSLALRDAELARSVLPSRPFIAEDLPRLLEAHRGRFAGCSVGGMERASSWYDPRHISSGFGRRARVRVFADGDAQAMGYLVYDDSLQQAVLAEVVAPRHASPALAAAVYDTAVAVMADVARGSGLAAIELRLPPTDPFMLHCRRYGVSVATEFQRDRGGMARICSLRSTLEAMLPEFEGRLSSGMEGIWLDTDLGAVGVVRHDGGGVRLTQDGPMDLPEFGLPQSLLTVLLVGYRGVDEVAADPACRADPEALEVARALFPLREPFVPAPDRF